MSKKPHLQFNTLVLKPFIKDLINVSASIDSNRVLSFEDSEEIVILHKLIAKFYKKKGENTKFLNIMKQQLNDDNDDSDNKLSTPTNLNSLIESNSDEDNDCDYPLNFEDDIESDGNNGSDNEKEEDELNNDAIEYDEDAGNISIINKTKQNTIPDCCSVKCSREQLQNIQKSSKWTVNSQDNHVIDEALETDENISNKNSLNVLDMTQYFSYTDIALKGQSGEKFITPSTIGSQ